jgi:hypothetical protein
MAEAATGFLHVVRIGGDIDPVNAEYRIAFAPLDGRLRGRQARCEGLDALTEAGQGPDSGDRTDLADSREAPGSLHPAHRPDPGPARGARALAAMSENCRGALREPEERRGGSPALGAAGVRELGVNMAP